MVGGVLHSCMPCRPVLLAINPPPLDVARTVGISNFKPMKVPYFLPKVHATHVPHVTERPMDEASLSFTLANLFRCDKISTGKV